MTATSSTTAAPPWARFIWTDARNVYVEVPATTGPAYVLTFALSEGGLSKALNLLRDAYSKARPAPIDYTKHSLVKRIGPNVTGDPLRQSVRDILRRNGLLPMEPGK